MPKRKTDPLLAALIAKLPATGTEWPAEQQQAWLRNMAMAFGLVYVGPPVVTVAEDYSWAKLVPAPSRSAPPPKPQKPMHPFIIDKKGYARRGSGERVLPSQVTAEMFDERGHEGDFRSITWADDSMGIADAPALIINA